MLTHVLTDERLQDRREIQFLLGEKLLLFGARIAQMQLSLFAVDTDVMQMDRSRIIARLTLHPWFPFAAACGLALVCLYERYAASGTRDQLSSSWRMRSRSLAASS